MSMFGEKERALKLVEGEGITLLEKDAQFEGKLTFQGKVQINGKFRGEIFSEGLLVIGEGAEIDAKIEIDTVIIQSNGKHLRQTPHRNAPAGFRPRRHRLA